MKSWQVSLCGFKRKRHERKLWFVGFGSLSLERFALSTFAIHICGCCATIRGVLNYYCNSGLSKSIGSEIYPYCIRTLLHNETTQDVSDWIRAYFFWKSHMTFLRSDLLFISQNKKYKQWFLHGVLYCINEEGRCKHHCKHFLFCNYLVKFRRLLKLKT